MRPRALKANTTLMPLEPAEFTLLLLGASVGVGELELGVEADVEPDGEEVKVTPCTELAEVQRTMDLT